MDKLKEFKKFIKTKPDLILKVHNNELSWQELYDAYNAKGTNHQLFNKTNLSKETLTNALKVFKDVDLAKVSEGLDNVKKVASALKEITNKEKSVIDDLPSYMKKASFKRFND